MVRRVTGIAHTGNINFILSKTKPSQKHSLSGLSELPGGGEGRRLVACVQAASRARAKVSEERKTQKKKEKEGTGAVGVEGREA